MHARHNYHIIHYHKINPPLKFSFSFFLSQRPTRLLRRLPDRPPLPEKEIVLLNRFCFLFSDFLPAKPDRRNLTTLSHYIRS